MKTLSSLLLIGFAVVLLAPRMAPAASAAEDKATYCGSGFTQYLVPDDVAGCSLSEACRLHDICYGRCDKDGDLYGSATRERTRTRCPSTRPRPSRSRGCISN